MSLRPPLGSGEWSFVVLPDTQNMVEFYPAIYQSMINWVLANRVTLNIQAVLHVGDLVNHYNVTAEWTTGVAGMSQLETVIPTGISAGNHDLGYPVAHPENFLTYFGPANYAGYPWYGAHRAGECDYWITWTVGGQQYIAIFLAWWFPADAAALAWAVGVMQANPGAHVILVAHQYITGGYPASTVGPGAAIWAAVGTEPNLWSVLCGHVPLDPVLGPEGRLDQAVPTASPDHHSQALMTNWQEVGSGGDGWLRVIEIGADGLATIHTLSPWLEAVKSDFTSLFRCRI